MGRDRKEDDMSSFLDAFISDDYEELEAVNVPPRFDKIDKSKIQMPDIKMPSIDDELEDGFFVGDEDFEQWDEDDYVEDMNSEFYDDGLPAEIRRIIDWEPPEPRSTDFMFENEFHSTGWVGFLHLDKILTDAIVQGASDVHIIADQVISFSRNGDIVRYPNYITPDHETMHGLITGGLLNHQQQSILNENLAYEGAYDLMHGPLSGRRTRISVGLSHGKFFVVFRIINDYIPSLSELKVEQEIVDWSRYPNGLFLICGPTGSGKSTTLASVISNVQKTTRKKIITIENPIEYVYPDNEEALVVQREVGEDIRSFYDGLSGAMRQSPDIILLGEVRNTEEVKELLRAAETGHLAISTMHTNSVATTINRIQNLFDGDEQRRIMSTLADTLRGIGNQVLVKDKNDGRFAVRELLTINDTIRDLILDGDVRGIRQYQIDREETMEHKLASAVIDGKCYKEVALDHVADPGLFNKILKEKGY